MTSWIPDPDDHPAENLDNEVHLVHPNNGHTLCGERIDYAWAPARAGAYLDVTCHQCSTQHYWLPAAGQLERDADLAKVFEPRPVGVRKHVTSDDGPARGRLARPALLQVCLTCGELRGPYGAYDNLCRCDDEQWDRQPIPRYGDLSNNAHLCWSCLADVVRSGTRWSPYYCKPCRPGVVLLRRLAGRSVVPVGPHSLMNGISWSSSDGHSMTDAEAVAFHDQLTALFRDQASLRGSILTRTIDRARRLGFTRHAVAVDDYVTACGDAGFTAASGFIEFVEALGADDASELAAEIWRRAGEASK